MTNPISGRLDRLEKHVEKKTNSGYGPVYSWINNPKDPDNAKKRKAAEKWLRENPSEIMIRQTVVSPPDYSSYPGYCYRRSENQRAPKSVH